MTARADGGVNILRILPGPGTKCQTGKENRRENSFDLHIR